MKSNHQITKKKSAHSSLKIIDEAKNLKIDPIIYQRKIDQTTIFNSFEKKVTTALLPSKKFGQNDSVSFPEEILQTNHLSLSETLSSSTGSTSEISNDVFISLIISLYQHATGKYHVSQCPDYLEEPSGEYKELEDFYQLVKGKKSSAFNSSSIMCLNKINWRSLLQIIKSEYKISLNPYCLYLNEQKEWVWYQCNTNSSLDSIKVALCYINHQICCIVPTRCLFSHEKNYIDYLILNLMENELISQSFERKLMSLKLEEVGNLLSEYTNVLLSCESLISINHFLKTNFDVKCHSLDELIILTQEKKTDQSNKVDFVEKVKDLILKQFIQKNNNILKLLSDELQFTKDLIFKRLSYDQIIEKIETESSFYKKGTSMYQGLELKQTWYRFLKRINDFFTDKINSSNINILKIQEAFDKDRNDKVDYLNSLLKNSFEEKQKIESFFIQKRIIANTQLSLLISSHFSEYFSKPIIKVYPDRIEIVGDSISTSELKKEPAYVKAMAKQKINSRKRLEFYFQNEIIFDESLICLGQCVTIYAKKLICRGKNIELITSGEIIQRYQDDFDKAIKKPATQVSINSPTGIPGTPGENGEAGENAGHIFIHFEEQEGLNQLSIQAIGARGEHGQFGGDGDNGINGKDGENGSEEKCEQEEKIGFYTSDSRWQNQTCKLYHGKPGMIGGLGGRGGTAGLGGEGGKRGNVDLEKGNQLVTDQFKNIFQASDGKEGNNGKAGNAGQNGKDGEDGKDLVTDVTGDYEGNSKTKNYYMYCKLEIIPASQSGFKTFLEQLFTGSSSSDANDHIHIKENTDIDRLNKNKIARETSRQIMINNAKLNESESKRERKKARSQIDHVLLFQQQKENYTHIKSQLQRAQHIHHSQLQQVTDALASLQLQVTLIMTKWQANKQNNRQFQVYRQTQLQLLPSPTVYPLGSRLELDQVLLILDELSANFKPALHEKLTNLPVSLPQQQLLMNTIQVVYASTPIETPLDLIDVAFKLHAALKNLQLKYQWSSQTVDKLTPLFYFLYHICLQLLEGKLIQENLALFVEMKNDATQLSLQKTADESLALFKCAYLVRESDHQKWEFIVQVRTKLTEQAKLSELKQFFLMQFKNQVEHLNSNYLNLLVAPKPIISEVSFIQILCQPYYHVFYLLDYPLEQKVTDFKRLPSLKHVYNILAELELILSRPAHYVWMIKHLEGNNAQLLEMIIQYMQTNSFILEHNFNPSLFKLASLKSYISSQPLLASLQPKLMTIEKIVIVKEAACSAKKELLLRLHSALKNHTDVLHQPNLFEQLINDLVVRIELSGNLLEKQLYQYEQIKSILDKQQDFKGELEQLKENWQQKTKLDIYSNDEVLSSPLLLTSDYHLIKIISQQDAMVQAELMEQIEVCLSRLNKIINVSSCSVQVKQEVQQFHQNILHILLEFYPTYSVTSLIHLINELPLDCDEIILFLDQATHEVTSERWALNIFLNAHVSQKPVYKEHLLILLTQLRFYLIDDFQPTQITALIQSLEDVPLMLNSILLILVNRWLHQAIYLKVGDLPTLQQKLSLVIPNFYDFINDCEQEGLRLIATRVYLQILIWLRSEQNSTGLTLNQTLYDILLSVRNMGQLIRLIKDHQYGSPQTAVLSITLKHIAWSLEEAEILHSILPNKANVNNEPHVFRMLFNANFDRYHVAPIQQRYYAKIQEYFSPFIDKEGIDEKYKFLVPLYEQLILFLDSLDALLDINNMFFSLSDIIKNHALIEKKVDNLVHSLAYLNLKKPLDFNNDLLNPLKSLKAKLDKLVSNKFEQSLRVIKTGIDIQNEDSLQLKKLLNSLLLINIDENIYWKLQDTLITNYEAARSKESESFSIDYVAYFILEEKANTMFFNVIKMRFNGLDRQAATRQEEVQALQQEFSSNINKIPNTTLAQKQEINFLLLKLEYSIKLTQAIKLTDVFWQNGDDLLQTELLKLQNYLSSSKDLLTQLRSIANCYAFKALKLKLNSEPDLLKTCFDFVKNQITIFLSPQKNIINLVNIKRYLMLLNFNDDQYKELHGLLSKIDVSLLQSKSSQKMLGTCLNLLSTAYLTTEFAEQLKTKIQSLSKERDRTIDKRLDFIVAQEQKWVNAFFFLLCIHQQSASIFYQDKKQFLETLSHVCLKSVEQERIREAHLTAAFDTLLKKSLAITFFRETNSLFFSASQTLPLLIKRYIVEFDSAEKNGNEKELQLRLLFLANLLRYHVSYTTRSNQFTLNLSENFQLLYQLYSFAHKFNLDEMLLPHLIPIENLLTNQVAQETKAHLAGVKQSSRQLIHTNLDELDKKLADIDNFKYRLQQRQLTYQAILTSNKHRTSLAAYDLAVPHRFQAVPNLPTTRLLSYAGLLDMKQPESLFKLGLLIANGFAIQAPAGKKQLFDFAYLLKTIDHLFSQVTKFDQGIFVNDEALCCYQMAGLLLALKNQWMDSISYTEEIGLADQLSQKFIQLYQQTQDVPSKQYRLHFLQTSFFVYYKNYFKPGRIKWLAAPETDFFQRYFALPKSLSNYLKFERLFSFFRLSTHQNSTSSLSSLNIVETFAWQTTYKQYWQQLVPSNDIATQLLTDSEKQLYDQINTFKSIFNKDLTVTLNQLFITFAPYSWQEELNHQGLNLIRHQIQLLLGLDETQLAPVFIKLHENYFLSKPPEDYISLLKTWPETAEQDDIMNCSLQHYLRGFVEEAPWYVQQANIMIAARASMHQFKLIFETHQLLKTLLNKGNFFAAKKHQQLTWYKLMHVWLIRLVSHNDWQQADIIAFLTYIAEGEHIEALTALFLEHYPNHWRAHFYGAGIKQLLKRQLLEGNVEISPELFRQFSIGLLRLQDQPLWLRTLFTRLLQGKDCFLAEQDLIDFVQLISTLTKSMLTENLLQKLSEQPLAQWSQRLCEEAWLQQLKLPASFSDLEEAKLIYTLWRCQYSLGINHLTYLLGLSVFQWLAHHDFPEFLSSLDRFTQGKWAFDKSQFVDIESKSLTEITLSTWVVTKNSIDQKTAELNRVERNYPVLIGLMQQEMTSYNLPIADILTSTLTSSCSLTQDIEKIINYRDLLKTCTQKNIQDWNKKRIEQSIDQMPSVMGESNIPVEDVLHYQVAIILRAVALIYSEAWNHQEVRHTQILGLWLLLQSDRDPQHKGRLAQIGTSEGKSIIVAMLALVKFMLGQSVDILTSSKVLAIRDAEDKNNQELFKLFDCMVSNNCDEACEDENTRTHRYKTSDVVYGEISYFQADFLKEKFYEGEIFGNRKADCLIVDEVDSLLLDKGSQVLYLSHDITELQHLRQIMVEIWLAVNDPQLTDAKPANLALVKEYIEKRLASEELVVPQSLMAFVVYRLPIWIENAFNAKVLEKDDGYILSQLPTTYYENSVVVMDKDTGVEQHTLHWSEGLHQFLQLRYNQPLSLESLKSVFISNFEYVKRYKKRVYGVTGTLGSQAELSLLAKTYEFDYFNLPRFKREQFCEEDAIVCDNTIDWEEATLNVVRAKQAQNHSCLLICENVAQAQVMAKKLAPYQLVGAPTEPYYSSTQVAISKIKPGQFIVATNLAGRGVDLKIDIKDKSGIVVKTDSIKANVLLKTAIKPVLHVVLTYLPDNIRIESQAFGRTARNGQSGTGQFIVCYPSSSNVPAPTIQSLKRIRDRQEIERLTLIEKHYLPKIRLEETLLNNFHNLYSIIKMKLKDNQYQEEYIYLQLKGLETQWAFWLDNQTPLINKQPSQASLLFIEFDKFKEKMLHQMNQNHVIKLVKTPTERVKLGRFFQSIIGKEQHASAESCFDKVIQKESLFAASAHYYRAASVFAKGHGDTHSRKEARHALKQAQYYFNQQLDGLRTSPSILSLINLQRQKQGDPVSNDRYAKDIESRLSSLAPHLKSIETGLGHGLDSTLFINTDKGIDETVANRLWDTLRKSDRHTFKNYRLSKKVHIDRKNQILYLMFENKKRIIHLPPPIWYASHLFYNLIENKKLNNRNVETDTFKDCVMDQSTFYNLLIKNKLIYPVIVTQLKTELASLNLGAFNPYKEKIGGVFKQTSAAFISQRNFKDHFFLFENFEALAAQLMTNGVIVSNDLFEEKLTQLFNTQTVSTVAAIDITQQALLRDLLKQYQGKWLPLDKLKSIIIQAHLEKIVFSQLITVFIEKNIVVEPVTYQIDATKASETITFFQNNYPYFDFVELITVFANQTSSFRKNDFPFPLTLEAGSQDLFKCLMQQEVIKEISVNFSLRQGEFENSFNKLKTVLNNEIRIEENNTHFINRLTNDAESKWNDSNDFSRRLFVIEQPIGDNNFVREIFNKKINEIKSIFIKKYQDQHREIIRDEIKQDYLNSLLETLKTSLGQLKTVPNLKINFEDLQTFYAKGELPKAIWWIIEQGLDQVIAFQMIKEAAGWDWGVLVVALLGVVEIAIGLVLETVSFGLATPLAAALISEGIGDIFYAVETGITGTFNWKEYGIQKGISLAISVVTLGIGAWLSRGARVAGRVGSIAHHGASNMATNEARSMIISQTIRNRIGTKIFETGAFALANVGIDALLDKVLDTLIQECCFSISKFIRSDSGSVQYKKAIRQKLQRWRHISGNSIDKEIIALITKVMGEVQTTADHVFDYGVRFAQSLLEQMQRATSVLEHAGVNGKIRVVQNCIKILNSLLNGIRLKRSQPQSQLRAGSIATLKALSDLSHLASATYTNFERLLDKKLSEFSTSNSSDQVCSNEHMDDIAWCEKIIQNLDDQIDKFFKEKVKSAILSPQIKTYAHQALRSTGPLINQAYYKAMDARVGNLTVRQHLEDIRFKYVKNAKQITYDALKNIADDTLVYNVKGKAHSLKALKEHYGEQTLFYQKADKTLFMQKPSFENYAKRIEEGKPGGRLELQLIADTKKKSICIVNFDDPNQIIKRIKPEEGIYRTEDEMRVAFIPASNDSQGVGHYMPCIKEKGRWQIISDLSNQGIPKNGCLYQSVNFIELYQQTGDHAQAKNHLKCIGIEKELRHLANQLRNNFKYQRLYRRDFHEFQPHLLGGATKDYKVKKVAKKAIRKRVITSKPVTTKDKPKFIKRDGLDVRINCSSYNLRRYKCQPNYPKDGGKGGGKPRPNPQIQDLFQFESLKTVYQLNKNDTFNLFPSNRSLLNANQYEKAPLLNMSPYSDEPTNRDHKLSDYAIRTLLSQINEKKIEDNKHDLTKTERDAIKSLAFAMTGKELEAKQVTDFINTAIINNSQNDRGIGNLKKARDLLTQGLDNIFIGNAFLNQKGLGSYFDPRVNFCPLTKSIILTARSLKIQQKFREVIRIFKLDDSLSVLTEPVVLKKEHYTGLFKKTVKRFILSSSMHGTMFGIKEARAIFEEHTDKPNLPLKEALLALNESNLNKAHGKRLK